MRLNGCALNSTTGELAILVAEAEGQRSSCLKGRDEEGIAQASPCCLGLNMLCAYACNRLKAE
eukprot:1140399-Pelagomonas_calceolata.AAC.1